MQCNYLKKKVKNIQNDFFQSSAFKPAKFTFDFYFCLPEQEALENLKKTFFGYSSVFRNEFKNSASGPNSRLSL